VKQVLINLDNFYPMAFCEEFLKEEEKNWSAERVIQRYFFYLPSLNTI